jgi:hypothetical protein
MSFNMPGNQSPGNSFRSAPYSKAFTAPSTLTDQITQAQCATTGAKLFVTTATPTLAYKDSAGNTVTLTTAIAGCAVGSQVDFYGIAMTEIVTLTNATLLAYWHAT